MNVLPSSPLGDQSCQLSPPGLNVPDQWVSPSFPAELTHRIPLARASATIALKRIAAVVAERALPAGRVVDHLDALALRVRHRGREVDVRIDADEVELSIGRHLVDDLGDRRSVIVGRRETAAAQVLRHDVGRQIAGGLTLGETIEAAVDDGDLHALAREALRVPRRCERRGDFLTAHCVFGARVRSTHAIDRRALLERVEVGRIDQSLDEISGCPLDAAAERFDARARL